MRKLTCSYCHKKQTNRQKAKNIWWSIISQFISGNKFCKKLFHAISQSVASLKKKTIFFSILEYHAVNG